MPKISRTGPRQLCLDFADLTEIDVPKIIDEYIPQTDDPITINELNRVLVDGIMWKVRNDQAGVDDNMCDTHLGDLPCGNAAEFVMEDGTKICYECYRIYLQRFGERTGKKFTEIS